MAATKQAKRETLNLRIKAAERNLIDRAAEAQGKTRTNFILEAARKAAQEALLDQTYLAVSPEVFAEFKRLLDAPPNPNERLQRTMRTPPPWKN